MNTKKYKLLNAIKIALILYLMTVGFFTTYAFVAHIIGIPLTNIVLWIIFGASCVSELGYVKWAAN